MTYDEWEADAPEDVRADPTWKVEAYRLAVFVAAAAWDDAEALARDPRSLGVVGQLVRSAGSVAANIAEGYGRRSPKERVRYYEFALGSAGECRAWYTTVGPAIQKHVLDGRFANLLSITRLLLTMIRCERDKPADWMKRAQAH
jgi:four helix bundle protein